MDEPKAKSSRTLRRLMIVVITAALRLTVVIFVTAHSTPVRLATTTISRFLHELSQEGRALRSRCYWAFVQARDHRRMLDTEGLAERESAQPAINILIYQGLENRPQSVSTNRYANRFEISCPARRRSRANGLL